jgi:lipopolysaccharide heptosyltransferase II
MSRSALESSVSGELERGGRVLVTRLSFLGDVVMSLSLIQRLRDYFPQVEIDYMTRKDGGQILEGEPLVDVIHHVPEGGVGTQVKLIRALRRRRYAVAIDLFSNPRSAFLVGMSGARMRIGGARRGRRQFYTHPMQVPRDVRAATGFHLWHARPLGVDSADAPPVPRLNITQAERDRADAQLRSHGIDMDAPIVGIHPGGKWEVKRWPAIYFAALATRLSEAYGMYRDAVVREAGDHVTSLPTLGLRDTAAVIHALDGMVLNDGGIMHVSVAVGTPTVGVFGSAEPEVWFPYEGAGPYAAACVPITCRPCHSHVCSHLSCLHKLTVERVEAKLLSVMRSKDPASSAATRTSQGTR